jgi:hypothetical protein
MLNLLVQLLYHQQRLVRQSLEAFVLFHRALDHALCGKNLVTWCLLKMLEAELFKLQMYLLDYVL